MTIRNGIIAVALIIVINVTDRNKASNTRSGFLLIISVINCYYSYASHVLIVYDDEIARRHDSCDRSYLWNFTIGEW